MAAEGYCRNSGTWGSPDAVKVGPPLGPPRRHSRPRHKTGRWAPHLPHGDHTTTASITTAKDRGTPLPWGPPQPGRIRGGPGDPDTRQEARLTPENQPPVREEDKLASPAWKLLEDLGAKKMEAPWGAGMEKMSVSVHPPRKRWATAPNPP